MQPVEFKEANLVFGKDQEGYLPLYVFRSGETIITKWRLTIVERLWLLITGTLWMHTISTGAIPPTSLCVQYPFKENNGNPRSDTEVSDTPD